MSDAVAPPTFSLREDLAWMWLISAVHEYETCGVRPADDMTGYPPIGLAWDPLAVGDEDTTCLLIRDAQEAGVLSAPEDMRIDFEFVDDGGDGYYRYLLRIDAPAPLVLASAAQEMTRLGDRDMAGADAAVAILRDAVEAGNRLHRQLLAFTAAVSSLR